MSKTLNFYHYKNIKHTNQTSKQQLLLSSQQPAQKNANPVVGHNSQCAQPAEYNSKDNIPKVAQANPYI